MSARSLLALLTCNLVACAVGPGDDELYSAYFGDAGVEAPEAEAGGPALAPADASVPLTPPGAPGSAANLDAALPAIDAFVPFPTFADASILADAAPMSAPEDAASAGDANVFGPQDAGSAARDAGSTAYRDAESAPSAPSCSPSSCNNNCLLLPRCCTATQQCGCETLLTHQCLPSVF